MRLLDQNGTVLAGGDNITQWGDVYLGEKTDRNGGASTRYYIEVENTESNFAVFRFYNIRCRSRSGQTLGERVNSETGVDRF